MRKADLQGSANDLSLMETANSTVLNTSLSPDMQATGSPLITGRYDPTQPVSKPSNWHQGDSIDNLKKYSYGRELQEQIAQRQEKKYNELQSERQNDVRLLQERRSHDPFGKQGSGSPLRDSYGNINTAKNKALSTLYDSPPSQRTLFAGASPAFSLKARLARENLLTRSTDNLLQPPSTSGRRALSQVDMPAEEPTSTARTGLEVSIPPKTPMIHTAQKSTFAPNSSLFSSTVQSPNPMQFLLPTPMFMFPPSPYAFPHSQVQSPQMHLGLAGLTGRSTHREDFSRTAHEDISQYETSNRYMSTERETGFTGNAYIDDKIAAKQEKSKRVQKYQALQDDLLRQIEDKKMMKEHGEMQRKYDDIVEEARMKRDNDELRERDRIEHDKRKVAFEGDQHTIHKLGPSQEYIRLKKLKGKRPRTPLEEVEERIRLEKLEIEKSKIAVLIQDKSAALKSEAAKKEAKLTGPENEQLAIVKDTLGHQQKLLQDQLTEVKARLMEINRERILNGYQVEELKQKLKQQQVMDEVKRAELFHTMVENQKYPSILPTITHLKLDKDEYSPFDFPVAVSDVRNRNRLKMNFEGGDSLDAMIAVQTHNLPLDYKFVPTNVKPTERVTLRPTIDESPDDDKHSGLKYLSYFNPMEHHTGIKVEDSTTRFDILDGYDKVIKFDTGKSSYDTAGEPVNLILRKNRDRLAVLEDLETKESIEYSQGLSNYKGALDNGLALY